MNFQFFTWVSILIIILQANKIWPRENVLSNAIQLTFDGNRSGEGYFSSSGHLLCYQSESHSGNPFYQIYLLDLRSGSNRLVSSGIGKTTVLGFTQAKKMFCMHPPILIQILQINKNKSMNLEIQEGIKNIVGIMTPRMIYL